jgi:argininosuccinate lyase
MVEFDDEFADVSSVMPQKKNPCTAEMVRGKTGRAIGLLMQLFATVDKLSTGYGLELQEMNACLWELIDIVRSSIKIMNGIITSLKIKKERMLEVSIKNNIMAVDLAEFIAKNISFREAHSFVGNIVKDLISSSKDLSKIGSDYIKEESERILGFPLLEISDDELKEIIDPSSSISRRDNIGGPAPSEIFRMLSARKEEIDEKKKYLFEKRKNIESAERMLRETVNKNI